MAITQSQIQEFTKRAKMAGLSDSQIALEIQKKVREFDVSAGLVQPTTVPSKQKPTTGVSQTEIIDDAQEEGGFVSKLIKGFVQPGIDYVKYVGEAGAQLGRFTFDPIFRKAVLGEKLTDEEIKKLSQEQSTYFVDESKLENRGETVLTGAKATAGGASYVIPFGKGAGLASKVFIPGFTTGALSEFSTEEATAESVATAGVFGAATAGVIEGIGGMISWARGKGDDLIRSSKKLQEGTRKIKVKPSVYAASEERAINQTLDKYKFKGTAQQQYEKLEPTLQKVEKKITDFIADNPDITVSKESIRKSFVDNLKSSLRTKDLTQKVALDEINGYLNDLLRASGDVGADVGQDLLESGTGDIPLATLREMKKILNQDSQSIFKKLENNTTLNSREKVIMAAWNSIDNAIGEVAKPIKKYLVEESNLYKAARPLSSARFNPPVQRIAGTSVPSGLTQKIRDVASTVLKKLGLASESLPEQNILQNPNVQRLFAMTPAMLKEKGLSDEEIDGVEQLKTSVQSSGVENQVSQTPRGGIDFETKPSPMNPFGNLSKRQVLALALSEGASSSDLEEVGKVYDMIANDSGVISGEMQQTADSLRAEYFKRTQENDWVDVLNSYQKVENTSDTPAGDVSLIFAFMKMLDPGSVVREGEFATAENTQGIPDRIRQQYNKALKGDRLSEKQRVAYKQEAGRVFQVYQQRQAPIDAYYQGLAQRYGIDPSLLGIGLYGQSSSGVPDTSMEVKKKVVAQ